MTNRGGGLKGTGVPLALRKVRTDHPIRIKATRKKSVVKMRENHLGNISEMPKNLSTCKAIMTTENINREKKSNPRGVKKFRIFLLLVAKGQCNESNSPTIKRHDPSPRCIEVSHRVAPDVYIHSLIDIPYRDCQFKCR